MLNFQYYNPVRVAFGKNSIRELPTLLPECSNVMVTYGGGSIFKNGVYAQVKAALAGCRVHEFGGIEPNPRYETCMQCVELARKEKIDFLLAVGGGSVVDGTKFIAAAIPWTQGDPWDILAKPGTVVDEAVPLGCVITLPATGSEMNNFSVVSRGETKEKLAFGSDKVYPKFSIIDPQVTYTLPPRQTVNGIVDTFVHVMEQYLTYDVNAPLQDHLAEGIVKTLLEEAPKVLQAPEDYEVRANLFWCSTLGLNGLIGCGVPQDWATHMIGHELTALYGLDHAVTLAIVLPRLWWYKKEEKKEKLARFGREIFGVLTEDETIAKTEAFFHSLGMKTKLADYGVDASHAASEVRKRFTERGAKFGEHGDIDAAAAFAILSNC